MRATLWLGVASAVGCVPMEPSGRPFEPVPVSAPAPRVAPAAATPTATPTAAPAPAGGFDFDAEDRDEAQGTGATDPVDLQAKLLGIEVPERPAPAPEPAAAPEVVAVAPPAPPAPVWDPSKPLADASFGVRVLATLLDIQPPRAILGLPDGAEQVVQPGAMLPEQGLVVLAIGRDAVQLAKVTPQGFYAAVRTETVQALYPNTGTP